MPKLPVIASVKKLRDKKVLLRLDLNVPLSGRSVRDDFRIKKIIPTLAFLRREGAKTIILAHIGKDGRESLKAVARHMNTMIPVGFAPDKDRAKTLAQIREMPRGGILLLENVRRFSGELENSKTFAKELAMLGDIFVNDAFSVSHREQASVVGVTKFLPSYLGPLFAREVEELSRAFRPKHPFVLILGGAKFSTKVPLVKRFLKLADTIYMSGALANSFLKEKGLPIGRSVADVDSAIVKPFLKEKKIILPDDVLVLSSKGKRVCLPGEVRKDEYIYDVGPQSAERLSRDIQKAKMVLWNGPLGYYEGGFTQATNDTARALAESSAVSILGGGDTVAAIESLKIMDKFTFVSTGGGAMLDFLAKGSLPGVKAVQNSKVKTKK